MPTLFSWAILVEFSSGFIRNSAQLFTHPWTVTMEFFVFIVTVGETSSHGGVRFHIQFRFFFNIGILKKSLNSHVTGRIIPFAIVHRSNTLFSIATWKNFNNGVSPNTVGMKIRGCLCDLYHSGRRDSRVRIRQLKWDVHTLFSFSSLNRWFRKT